MPDLEPDNDVSTKLNRLSEIARQNPKAKFTSLAYLLTEEFLIVCYHELNPQAAPGIDQVTYESYGENLPANIADLVERLKSQRYQATDIRRVWIPKPSGGERPLGILILEDKIVQRGVAKILSAIYEQDFLECSYGFRPQRSAHDALRAVELCIIKGNVNYILDIDISGYFDHASWYSYEKRKFLSLPDRSFLNNSSVEGLSGNKYKRVFGSRVICMHPL